MLRCNATGDFEQPRPQWRKNEQTKFKNQYIGLISKTKTPNLQHTFIVADFFFLVSHHHTAYNTVKLDRNDYAIVVFIQIVVSSIAIVATSISSEIPLESLINNTRSADLANPRVNSYFVLLSFFLLCLFHCPIWFYLKHLSILLVAGWETRNGWWIAMLILNMLWG